MITVTPKTTVYEVLLTTTTPVSHHDAAVQTDSNRTMFNRQKQIIYDDRGAPVTAPIDRMELSTENRVPMPLVPIMEMLTFHEFVGTVVTRLFIDMYNRQDGTGLFAGMERYERLESRLRLAAIPSQTLREMWSRLCQSLQVPMHPARFDQPLLHVMSLPSGTQQCVLKILAEQSRMIVAVAREWHTTVKQAVPSYAEKAQQELDLLASPEYAQALEFAEEDERPPVRIIEAPAISANSLRHQMVRAPARMHLLAALGLEPAQPGQGPLPEGLDALLDNGGNIAAGAKAPTNAHKLAWQAREAFPSLSLLGGTTDSFDLGESALGVTSWVVCRENLDGIYDSPAAELQMAQASIFDMLDDITLTRQSYSKATGQMILSFETLVKGAQILARFVVKPFASTLTHGALIAAIDYYLANHGVVGGQSARGFGYLSGEWLVRPESAEENKAAYEAYLQEHREELLAGLVDGTLCTDKVLCER